jgi:outer membrane protein
MRSDITRRSANRLRLVRGTPTWRAGPIGRIKFSRNEDGEQTFAVGGGDTNDLRGLGDVDAAIELGGFVEYELGAVTFSAEARQAVSDTRVGLPI